MAYKQSPFPMIAGTSPVKSLGRLKTGVNIVKKIGRKVGQYFTKTKTNPITLPGANASMSELTALTPSQRVQRNLELSKSNLHSSSQMTDKLGNKFNPSKDVVKVSKSGGVVKIGGSTTIKGKHGPVSTNPRF